MIDDRHDRRLALRAPGLLATFNRADVLSAADVHVAARLGAMTEETDEQVLLATALAVRAVRQGSTCLDLTTVADVPLEDETDAQEVLPWPEPEAWQAAVAASPLVRLEVLRFDNALLYLDRYWREEVQVCRDVVGRLDREAPEVDSEILDAGVLRVFPEDGYEEQRDGRAGGRPALDHRADRRPGHRQDHHRRRPARPARRAGRARAGRRRPQPPDRAERADRQGVGQAAAVGRGPRPGSCPRPTATGSATCSPRPCTGCSAGGPTAASGSGTTAANRLPHDVIVVDETSMVSLTMMARLLEAVRPDTRLVLVGDPGQLASVEAGAVLADLVDGFGRRSESPVAPLTHVAPLRRRDRRPGPGAARRRRRPGDRGAPAVAATSS